MRCAFFCNTRMMVTFRRGVGPRCRKVRRIVERFGRVGDVALPMRYNTSEVYVLIYHVSCLRISYLMARASCFHLLTLS